MVAHCTLTHTGEVKIRYTGEMKTKPKTENMKKVSAVLETNKGREPRHSRTNSYWYGSYFQTKSWKKYRKNQQKGVVSRENYRFLPDNLTEEFEVYSLHDYMQEYCQ
jgi:hypothetical protein